MLKEHLELNFVGVALIWFVSHWKVQRQDRIASDRITYFRFDGIFNSTTISQMVWLTHIHFIYCESIDEFSIVCEQWLNIFINTDGSSIGNTSRFYWTMSLEFQRVLNLFNIQLRTFFHSSLRNKSIFNHLWLIHDREVSTLFELLTHRLALTYGCECECVYELNV